MIVIGAHLTYTMPKIINGYFNKTVFVYSCFHIKGLHLNYN